jgi:hypothetical protein
VITIVGFKGVLKADLLCFCNKLIDFLWNQSVDFFWYPTAYFIKMNIFFYKIQLYLFIFFAGSNLSVKRISFVFCIQRVREMVVASEWSTPCRASGQGLKKKD